MITIKKSNVYPKHTSLIKGNKKTENFFQKLDENPCKPAIMEAYHDIDSQIEVTIFLKSIFIKNIDNKWSVDGFF